MNGKTRILGVTILAAVFIAGAPDAAADRFGEGSRGHRHTGYSSTHDGGSHATVSVQFEGHHGHKRHRAHRRHRNAHLFHAATFALGSLAHHGYATGHYETRKVLVRSGYYEDYRVHVPAAYDPVTCRRIRRAHYETRTRWVEPVYEYRKVWVEHH